MDWSSADQVFGPRTLVEQQHANAVADVLCVPKAE